MPPSTAGPDIRCDLVIVGAGPAGTSAALAAIDANPDLDVVIVDAKPPGRDKVCGDAVGPDALGVLARLGVHTLLGADERARTFRVRDIAGNEVGGPSPVPGFVVPRRQFDARLLGAATAAGATFAQGRAATLTQDRAGVRLGLRDGRHIVAAHLIGADGANSATRTMLGLPANADRHLSVAVRGYAANPDGEHTLDIIWDTSVGGVAYAWSFPTADGRRNVGYGATVAAVKRGVGGVRGKALLHTRARDLLGNIDGVQLCAARLPTSNHRMRAGHGRVLLTGDAASLINPLSGEGIFYALLSGSLAGEACAHGTGAARAYTRRLDSRLRSHTHQTTTMAATTSPTLIAGAINAAAADSALFDSLLAVTLGEGTLTLRQGARIAAAAGVALRRR